jgi:glycosyltransferase involved in cell wall biosynthesis
MKISQSVFTIVTNGFADGPAQPLRDYLLLNKAKKLIMINHPLVAEGSNKHIVTIYEKGKQVSQKKYPAPNKPPYTFVLDPLLPLRVPPSTAWFAFNNLAALKGLRQKNRGKTKKVYYWAVDFVPNRFGNNFLTTTYNKVDRLVSQKADGRIELTQTALEQRPDYLNLDKSHMAPALVAPMGTWLDRTPKAGPKAWQQKKVVYLGHLVERQGVATLVNALGILIKKEPSVTAEIVGGGPLLADLKNLAKKLGIDKQVTFHGFVKDHKDVEAILASGTVAAAPYVKDETNFTQFADPGKLKAYMGASLPMVITDVPPNAAELEKAGAALIVDDSPEAVAAGLETLLTDQNKWQKAQRGSIELAKEFDWNRILASTLNQLGFE